MKKKIYKIFEVDECNGKEYKIANTYERITTEKLVLLSSENSGACTSYCYYDSDGTKYDLRDIKTMYGITE
jgi:hypothetical protein